MKYIIDTIVFFQNVLDINKKQTNNITTTTTTNQEKKIYIFQLFLQNALDAPLNIQFQCV